MEVEQLPIAGACIFKPRIHKDSRGLFLEAFTLTSIATCTPDGFGVAQMNLSVTKRLGVRGIHLTAAWYPQAKYVSCVQGRILDFQVDLRIASSDFGRWNSLELNEDNRQAVLIPHGVGHAFQALTSTATVVYLTTSPYVPEAELAVNPFDPDLGLAWDAIDRGLVSVRDLEAPSLREFKRSIRA